MQLQQISSSKTISWETASDIFKTDHGTLRIKLSVWIKWQENVRFDSHGSRRTNNVAQTHCHHSDISSALRHCAVVTRVPTSKLLSATRFSKLKHHCTRQLSTLTLVNSLDPCTCFPVTTNHWSGPGRAISSVCVTFNLHTWHADSPSHCLGQVHRPRSQVKVQGHRKKQQLSNCWEGLSWLKSKPELKTVNK